MQDPQFVAELFQSRRTARWRRAITKRPKPRCRRAVEVAPDSESAHSALANFLWAAGDTREAELELTASLKIAPQSTHVNRALATIRLAENRLPEAEPYLRGVRRIAAGPRNRELLLADYLVRIRKTPDAVTVLERLAKEDVGFAPATLRLAALDFTGGRRPEAFRRLETIIERRPAYELAQGVPRRDFCWWSGRTKEALAVATALVDANPKSVAGHHVRGLALRGDGFVRRSDRRRSRKCFATLHRRFRHR